MFADLTLWTIRDSMFGCTLWIGPQVFTGGCLVTRGQGAGYWCCGRPLGWIRAMPLREKGCSLLPHLAPRTEWAWSSCLPSPGPASRPIPLLSCELTHSRKLVCGDVNVQVCAQRGWQFAATISHSAVLNGRDSHGGSEPQPWCWVMWMSAWCFRGFMSEVSFLQPQESCTDTSPTEVRRSKCGFNYWGPRTSQHTLSFPLLFSANIPLLIYTLWSSFSLTVM